MGSNSGPCQDTSSSSVQFHPNGAPILTEKYIRKERNDDPIFANVFPDNYLGKLLHGMLVQYLSKLEPRAGWAQRSVCDNMPLTCHPCEVVGSHMWGLCCLITCICREPKFQEERPNFDELKALQMAIVHDIPEVITGDYTPRDNIPEQVKHEKERVAMKKILSCLPDYTRAHLERLYLTYEQRATQESRFVKDCDLLDFVITAFMYERQGFTGFSEFYKNCSILERFDTQIAKDLAVTLIKTREELIKTNQMYQIC